MSAGARGAVFKCNGRVHLKLDFKVDLQGLHDELEATADGAINQNNAEFADVIGGRE
jgi:hypothetical protein